MPRFFAQPGEIGESEVKLAGDNAHHISRSLRMAAGEKITVCDGEGKDYLCELTAFLPDHVEAKILSSAESETEPPYFITVYQALAKGDKLDSVIQKSVECGACELIPFESSHCIVRIKDDDGKKTSRRSRIALEAAKQCGRGRIPAVGDSIPFRQAVQRACKADLPLFCYEGEGTEPLARVLREYRKKTPLPKTVSVMVGSEGGFSPEEAELAKSAGMYPIGLGKRILRTETAASFVLGCLAYEFELF